MSSRYSKQLFTSAAVFNFLACAILLLCSGPLAGFAQFEINPTATLFIQVVAGLVGFFGWAYWKIATDPVLYRPYILLGAILKVMIVTLIYGHWLAGNIAWPLPALASGDIVFAVLFWRFYLQQEIPAGNQTTHP
jgi:hypothetical protein